MHRCDFLSWLFRFSLLDFQLRRKEIFYLMTHSTHFMYGYMASDIWLRTILIVRKKTCCRHIGYSFRFTARVLLYATSNRQDSTYHSLCYTSRGALAGMRNSSMGPPHEGSHHQHHEQTLLPRSYISLLNLEVQIEGYDKTQVMSTGRDSGKGRR